jgi:hypothetical protein
MAAFITGKLLFIALLLLIITAIETLANRLSGGKGRPHCHCFVPFQFHCPHIQVSTLFQQPMTAKLADLAPEEDKLGFL